MKTLQTFKQVIRRNIYNSSSTVAVKAAAVGARELHSTTLSVALVGTVVGLLVTGCGASKYIPRPPVAKTTAQRNPPSEFEPRPQQESDQDSESTEGNRNEETPGTVLAPTPPPSSFPTSGNSPQPSFPEVSTVRPMPRPKTLGAKKPGQPSAPAVTLPPLPDLTNPRGARSSVSFAGVVQREAEYGISQGTQTSCQFSPAINQYTIQLIKTGDPAQRTYGAADGIIFTFNNVAPWEVTKVGVDSNTRVRVVLQEFNADHVFGLESDKPATCTFAAKRSGDLLALSFDCPKMLNDGKKVVHARGSAECRLTE